MCGIVYAKNKHNNNDISQLVKAMYIAQKDRGQQGFGWLGLTKKDTFLFRGLTEQEFINSLDSKEYDEILSHHRLPTSTENYLEATHPFELEYKDKKYYFIHNGMVFNDIELKAIHNDKYGIEYTSERVEKHNRVKFNDSEALAWDFILKLNKQKDFEAESVMAFICLEVDKETNKAIRLWFYRNENPLKMYNDKTLFLLSSEGIGENIKTRTLYYYDYASKNVRKSKIRLKDDYEAVASSGSVLTYNYQTQCYEPYQRDIGFKDEEELPDWKDWDNWKSNNTSKKKTQPTPAKKVLQKQRQQENKNKQGNNKNKNKNKKKTIDTKHIPQKYYSK